MISNDAIAIIVHTTNPFKDGLTSTQIAGIFQGNIPKWSDVGGSPDPIRVINRPKESGTYECFKKMALKGGDFGDFMTVEDGSTVLIRELKKDGIGYATYKQAARESTVRIVAIDNSVPGASNYPYRRQLFYVYKNPPNPAVQAFWATQLQSR